MADIRPYLGKLPRIADNVWIDPTAVVIGDVEIGDGSSVWPTTVIRGDVHSICIGERTNIQDGAVFHVSHDSQFCPGGQPLVVGDGVTVGHRVILHGCRVGNYCLIGMGAIIMDGAVLGSKVIVGAGSVVTGDAELDSNSLWVGSPAQRVRALNGSELEYLEYSAQHYVRLGEQHMKGE